MKPRLHRRDWPFYAALGVLAAAYALLVAAMVAATTGYVLQPAAAESPAAAWGAAHPTWARIVPPALGAALADDDIQSAVRLTLVASTLATILALWVGVPTGYLLARTRFRGRMLLDALADVPLVLPPMVVGVSLLLLFRFLPRSWGDAVIYERPAIVLAQFVVAASLVARTMKATFAHVSPRAEQVALTLGCTPRQAFGRVALPEARRGLLAAATLAWARSLGEFGPVLVFAGAVRGKTEVLATSVFLELSVGNLVGAAAVSLVMIAAAAIVLAITRIWGGDAAT